MKTLVALIFFFAFAFAQTNPPEFPDTVYGPYVKLVSSLELNGYTFELWSPDSKDSFAGRALRTISPDGEVIETEDFMIELAQTDNNDINKNGIPDIEIQSFSGGAHCCFGTTVLELSSPAAVIFDHPFSECPAVAEDLDNDGIPEYQSCDDRWAYEYCSYAESPLPTVVWRWNGDVYELASQDYPQAYQAELSRALELFLSLRAETVEWTPAPECSALALTLPYLYMGQEELAYEALKLSYSPEKVEDDAIFTSFDNVEDFWQNILQVYNESPLHTPLSQP
ncbi:MAG: hypothetical protein KC422_15160 [Trueperaceae bacterium]|nr:hypothetical protein [Trueperaceae bacterium]